MKSSQHTRKFIILGLVILAALALQFNSLKPGLDIGGGTSLVYEIDTTGLESSEMGSIAQRMIPIIQRRVDPGNMTNMVIRPQGNTRIEIQLPLASAETVQKRMDYQEAFDNLESKNLNLAVVRRYLTLDPEERNVKFKEFAGDDEGRLKILTDLASIYDVRKETQAKRDELNNSIEDAKVKLESLEMSSTKISEVETKSFEWAELEQDALIGEIENFVKGPETEGDEEKSLNADDKEKVAAISNYVAINKDRIKVYDQLTNTDAGLDVLYQDALAKLRSLNLSVDGLAKMLDSKKRGEYLDSQKMAFSDREEEISAFVTAFDAYKSDRGRLDDPEDLKRMLKGSGVLEFRILPRQEQNASLSRYVDDLATKGPKGASDTTYKWFEIEDVNTFRVPGAYIADFADKYYVLASNVKADSLLASHGNGWKLTKSYATQDEYGRRAIGFILNQSGSNMFAALTRKNIDNPLCIMLDNVAISAPNIQSEISGKGVITGEYNVADQSDMINKLNAGSLPARLSESPISEKTIGPLMGADNRDKGIRAAWIGLAVVAVFMILYYRYAGILAVIALLMNILFILAVMSLCGWTFTLPGIAGLILTVGMAVDANVLIFERIREEQAKGSGIKIAVANGYEKAFMTILDANVTTFITALILYAVASEELKGFAIVLMIGIISSMFTALFVTRVLFDSLIDAGKIKNQINMSSLIGTPNINWMGKRKLFFVISASLMLLGLGVFFGRNDTENSKYDIEFTGGTGLTLNFIEPIDRADVVGALPVDLHAKVYSVGDTNKQYEIVTTATNKTVITAKIDNAELESVEKALNKISASGEHLSDLSVEKVEENYVVTTTQSSKTVINKVFAKAFSKKDAENNLVANYEIVDIKVNEIVNEAVNKAFEGKLEKQEDLGLAVVSVETIDDGVIEANPELADYIKGLKFNCVLDSEVDGAKIDSRIKDLRFKPDMQDVEWPKYVLLSDNMQPLTEAGKVKSFVYASIPAEAGYREFSKDELGRFESAERDKLEMAGAIETSLQRVTKIDPSVGQEAKRKALIAIVLSLFAIVGYVWIRFGRANFGFAAIAALVHDVCITLGAVTVCYFVANSAIGKALMIRDFKINLEMIAAFLTIIGYSLNDTIVVFDRIRENRGNKSNLSEELLTRSINQTLSRTLLTSFTTFVVVLIMYIAGGVSLRGFTFAMLIGIVVGTYSSIAIAAPILLLGKKKSQDHE